MTYHKETRAEGELSKFKIGEYDRDEAGCVGPVIHEYDTLE